VEDDVKILLNGDFVETTDGATIDSLLLQLDISRERVAVELNAEIVPKAGYATQFLSDDDKIEIVHFVGGG
jgi:thiamine biosynthesis protein ThiS